jgi:hypothetical protein
MKFVHVIHEFNGHYRCREGMSQGYEMSKFTESVNDYQNAIISARAWQSFNEVHGYDLPSRI